MTPRLRFTAHAELRIRQRGLAHAWVERVAGSPEWTEPDPRPGVVRGFGRIAEAGGRVLRVAYIDRDGVRHVLSASFDRRQTRRTKR